MNIVRLIIMMLIIGSIFLMSRNWIKSKDEPSIFDVPKKLQDNKMSLKVYPFARTGGAEVYSTSHSGGEDDRLYLEPATAYLAVTPENFTRMRDSGYALKLYGAFYVGKGIPARFLGMQPRPDKYSVFRYESMDVVKE